MGDYQSALVYFKNHIEARDSLFSKDKNVILYDMKIKYDTERKDDEIKVLNQSRPKRKRD